MAQYDLNKALKAENAKADKRIKSSEVALDDLTRVKILSPGRKVLKRFISNKLAIVGFVTLAIIFLFAFVGPLLYPYGQTQVFYTNKSQNIVYGSVTPSTTYTGYVLDNSINVNTNTNSFMTTYIKELEKLGVSSLNKKGEDDNVYIVRKLGQEIYTLGQYETTPIVKFGSNLVNVGVYDQVIKKFKYAGEFSYGEDFEKAIKSAKGSSGTIVVNGQTFTYSKGVGKSLNVTTVSNDLIYEGDPMGEDFEALLNSKSDFTYNGDRYIVFAAGDSNVCYKIANEKTAKVFSTFRIDTFDGSEVSSDFLGQALVNAYTGRTFAYNGNNYHVVKENGVLSIKDSKNNEYGEFTTMIVRRNNGDDSMEYGLKQALVEEITKMNSSRTLESAISYRLPMQAEDGSYAYDEQGNLMFADSEIRIIQKAVGGSDAISYQLNCNQIIYVIDRFANPSFTHILGTDGDGFDVFSRIMYGGRVSLLVGFVVVFLELILGVIMGGIAGFYGGWVDNLIMRLVDIFYCLPSMPIMIILGSMMDAMRLDVYTRLYIMMAALGIMGWAGTARMVRGQILSFREQEFMIAAEATGLKTRTRIFKHLVPNVMPQLIVSATMGMGGTILTESTLSFLGLGVKHPLATWGTMINSVSSASAMAHYAYIWIPVGLLICITVVAFNFVGDGLRDAYDPKSKR